MSCCPGSNFELACYGPLVGWPGGRVATIPAGPDTPLMPRGDGFKGRLTSNNF